MPLNLEIRGVTRRVLISRDFKVARHQPPSCDTPVGPGAVVEKEKRKNWLMAGNTGT